MLADLHHSLLQRIIDACDSADLFLLRQVSPRFRYAVDGRIRRLKAVSQLSPHLGDNFPNLHTLDLTACDQATAAQHTVAIVSQLPRLEELMLNFAPADSQHNSQWPEALGRLTRLDLRGGPGKWVASQALASMTAHCRSLQRLQLSSCSLRWEVVRIAVACLSATLTELQLDRNYFQAALPVDLSDLNTGKLRTLRLSHTLVDNVPEMQPGAAYAGLDAFTSLTSLDMNSYILNDDGIYRLNALTGLTSLNLDCYFVTYEALAELTRLPRLAHLRISNHEGPWLSASTLAAMLL